MKRVGVTGSPASGKTTLWKAITGGPTSGDIATVEVPDTRLDRLVEMHSSRKRVAAHIEIVDVHASAKTHASSIARLREMDALLLTAPAFGGQDAEEDLRKVTEDLILADLQPVESRLDRARKDPSAKNEIPVLESAKSVLEEGRFLSTEKWEDGEMAVFSSLAPITLKPLVVVVNVGEGDLERDTSAIPYTSFSVDAALEAELAGVDESEALELLSAYGITQSALSRLVDAIYRSLDLITFLTTSDKESRAWEVRRGARAPEAAGVIHSDMQRGFIRAEVISFEELEEIGHWDVAKVQKKIRVEGKEYVFKEGDVAHFLFAV